MAEPGEELQGADGVTRASEINKAGWSTAGVRSVGAPQARSGMVGLDGPSVVLFSRSRTVLLDARNWGRRMQGSGHTGVPAAQPSAGCHFPTCPHPAHCIFRHVPFLSFDSFSSSNPPDIARHDEPPPLAVDHSPPGGGRTRQMVSTWPDARLLSPSTSCRHNNYGLNTYVFCIKGTEIWGASAAWRPHPCAHCSIKQPADTHRGDTVSDQRAGKVQNSGPRQQQKTWHHARDTPPLQSDALKTRRHPDLPESRCWKRRASREVVCP